MQSFSESRTQTLHGALMLHGWVDDREGEWKEDVWGQPRRGGEAAD